jgi:single-stranded DNA-binding protein
VWGKSGESFASLAKKGQEVIIEGQSRRNDWESEDGQKHSKHFLKAESWQLTQYRRQDDSTEAAPEKGTKETEKVTSTNKSGRELAEPASALSVTRLSR